MIIQHNISALGAHRQLSVNNSQTAKNLEKLSSGYQVNRAGDNAAGLAISEKMRGQIRGLGMAEQNTSHAINLLQTAEGALQETHEILQRMRELSVQSANGTYENAVDRHNLEKEYAALMGEVDRISESTHYNNLKLFEQSLQRVTTTDSEIDPNDQSINSNYRKLINGLTSVIDTSASEGKFFSRYSSTTSEIGTTETYKCPEFILDLRIDLQGNVSGISLVSPQDNTMSITVTGNTVKVLETSTQAWMIFEIHGDIFEKWDFAGGHIRMDASINVGSGGASSGNDLKFVPVMTAGSFMFKWDMADASFDFQIGANGGQDQHSAVQMREMTAAALHIDHTGIASQTAADQALNSLDDAINEVSSFRADIGALQNRLEHTMNNLGTTRENLTAAESNIRDTDMAQEMMEYTKQSILIQASQAMLAQAQSLPQGILQLLA